MVPYNTILSRISEAPYMMLQRSYSKYPLPVFDNYIEYISQYGTIYANMLNLNGAQHGCTIITTMYTVSTKISQTFLKFLKLSNFHQIWHTAMSINA